MIRIPLTKFKKIRFDYDNRWSGFLCIRNSTNRSYFCNWIRSTVICLTSKVFNFTRMVKPLNKVTVRLKLTTTKLQNKYHFSKPKILILQFGKILCNLFNKKNIKNLILIHFLATSSQHALLSMCYN